MKAPDLLAVEALGFQPRVSAAKKGSGAFKRRETIKGFSHGLPFSPSRPLKTPGRHECRYKTEWILRHRFPRRHASKVKAPDFSQGSGAFKRRETIKGFSRGPPFSPSRPLKTPGRHECRYKTEWILRHRFPRRHASKVKAPDFSQGSGAFKRRETIASHYKRL